MAPVQSPTSAFSPQGREAHTVAAQLEGALLFSADPFPYFMLVALEAGGPLRALLLLLLSPFLPLLGKPLAVRAMTFVSMAGLRMSDVKAVAKATLCRSYMAAVGEEAFRVLSGCGGRRCVVASAMPRVMVDPFLRECLGVDCIVGAEMRATKGGYCLGVVAAAPGGDVGWFRGAAGAGEHGAFDVGLVGSSGTGEYSSFTSICRELYVTPPAKKAATLPTSRYPKPLVFHDGRLVCNPSPLDALVLFIWIPFAFCLATTRILIGALLPYKLALAAAAATGFRIRATFAADKTSTPDQERGRRGGTLYVCCHRTLIDPVLVSSTLQRPVMAVTYSLSRVSELLSPIPTFRLTRDRVKDGRLMRGLLEKGDLVVCPEGTTCREPFLLRFSPLFAEVAAEGPGVVPVAVDVEGSMFFGTTVRGYKCLDSFFFLMNPRPWYRLQYLERVLVAGAGIDGMGMGCTGSYQVANNVQKRIAEALRFECTGFTRRDKYRMIAGNDGVEHKS